MLSLLPVRLLIWPDGTFDSFVHGMCCNALHLHCTYIMILSPTLFTQGRVGLLQLHQCTEPGAASLKFLRLGGPRSYEISLLLHALLAPLGIGIQKARTRLW